MSESAGETKKSEALRTFYEHVGRVASEWAALELDLNRCLWALAWTDEPIGACLTSQIYSADARIKALISLLTVRSADKELVTKVNRLSERMRVALELRNRIIHDPWAAADDGKPFQLAITANRKLRFELVYRDMEELKREYVTIKGIVDDFNSLAKQIVDWQQASRKTWLKELLTMFVRNRQASPDEETPSSETL